MSEKRLEDMKRGEIRWSDRDTGWEMLIPSNAFKNANSSLFGSKPFRLVLSDLHVLYPYLDAYVDRHRGVLLGGADDPGTFFVKIVKTTSRDAAYDQKPSMKLGVSPSSDTGSTIRLPVAVPSKGCYPMDRTTFAMSLPPTS